jgi:2-aminoadipate transaminase
MKRSVIRELLKLTAQPDIISFAGGLPAPATFPVEAVRKAVNVVLDTEPDKALQYGATEGDIRLREDLAQVMQEDGTPADPSRLMILTASQQGLDLVAKIFLDPGDTCVVGLPTYLGALQAFKSYKAVPVGVRLDDEGMPPEKLEAVLDLLESDNRRPRFIYIVPDFHNPAGVTIHEDRRKAIISIARKRDYLIIEDTPYRQLRYRGEHQTTFQKMAPDCVMSLFTFSKILLPGFRLGWAYGPDWVIDKMVMAKQAVDLCTPPFCQAVAHHMIEDGALRAGLKEKIVLYGGRCQLMLNCLEKELSLVPGIHWTRPEGGLFLWLTLPEGMSTDDLFEKAIANKVAYVPGSAFYPNNENQRSMRLNFSYASDIQIEEGISRLARMIHEEL